MNFREIVNLIEIYFALSLISCVLGPLLCIWGFLEEAWRISFHIE
jgi:hypothetical protein